MIIKDREEVVLSEKQTRIERAFTAFLYGNIAIVRIRKLNCVKERA